MPVDTGNALNDSDAVYARVVRDARRSFGPIIGEDAAESAARDAVDDLLIRRSARVITFVPVLAMRQIRETIAVSRAVGD